MKLVIVERPGVAHSLARVMGADKRQEGYRNKTTDLCGIAGKDIIEKNNKQSTGKGVMRKIILIICHSMERVLNCSAALE